MSRVEFLVEEPSAEAALRNILPSILSPEIGFRIASFEGKPDLLNKLPSRLEGYSSWLPEDWWVVIVVDRDTDDCGVLKQKLENIAIQQGLNTKSSPHYSGEFQAITRIAIEELEAWFFGDTDAICSAYPEVPETLHDRAAYRDPDNITGGTGERLERVLQRAGYHKGGLEKIRAAKEISEHMNPDTNRSRSFQIFRDAIVEL